MVKSPERMYFRCASGHGWSEPFLKLIETHSPFGVYEVNFGQHARCPVCGKRHCDMDFEPVRGRIVPFEPRSC